MSSQGICAPWAQPGLADSPEHLQRGRVERGCADNIRQFCVIEERLLVWKGDLHADLIGQGRKAELSSHIVYI